MATLQDLLNWSKTVEIRVDVHNYEDIREIAINNAFVQREAYLERREQRDSSFMRFETDDYEPRDENRAIANYLRHHASNYDTLLEQLENLLDDVAWIADEDPTDEEIDAFRAARLEAYMTVR